MKSLASLFLSIILFNSILPAQDTNTAERTRAIISTNLGDIGICLYNETPLHRDNFIKLTNEGFYEELLFHRVIKDFLIQGGDPLSRGADKGVLLGRSGPGYTIPAEIIPGFYHKKGAIAAARTSDENNPSRASSGSQFYIIVGKVLSRGELQFMEFNNICIPLTEDMINDYTTVGGSPHLDGAYTVFGEVTKNIELVEKISQLQTDPYNRPLTDITFTVKILD